MKSLKRSMVLRWMDLCHLHYEKLQVLQDNTKMVSSYQKSQEWDVSRIRIEKHGCSCGSQW
jgi:hypothetical protein